MYAAFRTGGGVCICDSTNNFVTSQPGQLKNSLHFCERGFAAGNAAEDDHARQAMQRESAGRFAGAIQARNHLAVDIDYLALVLILKPARQSCRIGVDHAA